jgi:acyl carrier protein
MTSLTFTRRTSALQEGLVTKKVRALIAEHLGVDVECVTDDSDFTDDLGVDFLDLVELMILIEDQFADVEITDDDADQIASVGDLIRHVELQRQPA